jgi:hypothetical protein
LVHSSSNRVRSRGVGRGGEQANEARKGAHLQFQARTGGPRVSHERDEAGRVERRIVQDRRRPANGSQAEQREGWRGKEKGQAVEETREEQEETPPND